MASVLRVASGVAVLLVQQHAAAAEWTPLQQAAVESPTGVAISPSGEYAAFTVGSVAGTLGNLTAGGSMSVIALTNVTTNATGATTAAPAAADAPSHRVALCEDGGCAAPAFAADGSLAFLHSGSLYSLDIAGGAAAAPKQVDTGPAATHGGVLAFAVSPTGDRVAFTYAETGSYSTTEPRVISDTDVIVNVIAGTPTPVRNVLCVGPYGEKAAAATAKGDGSSVHCYDAASYASVGMEGWRISCWPFDSQFSWRAAGGGKPATLALTLTDDRSANGWESVRLATVDATDAAAAFVPVPRGDLAFQPLYSPDGSKLAYTRADTADAYAAGKPGSYTWAQTWQVCVADANPAAAGAEVSGIANAVCDTVGTADAMPVLVGFAAGGAEILYMEQNGTEVRLFSLTTADPSAAKTLVTGTPCSHDGVDCGVLGGGFRATARVVLSADGEHVAFSWENLHTAPQAFVGRLASQRGKQQQQQLYQRGSRSGAAAAAGAGVAVVGARQISALNTAAAGQAWPDVTTRTWHSDDGTEVQGLLVHAIRAGAGDRGSSNGTRAAAATNEAPETAAAVTASPLLVFTHCGPAMASLSTFIGAGSVCARFPVATWAQRGYNVLLPNYRGSTGYGRDFRRGDLDGWGSPTGDYADVLSGVKDLAASGVADLDNVGHVGWSYGGYLGALALTRAKTTHGITLKAVVAGGLLSDLISQTGTTDISKIYQSSNSQQYYWQSADVEANFFARSAMYHVANATAPVLMLHGQRDPRMPISQAFQLHYALRARNVTSRFLVFPGSGHIPGDPNQIVRVWEESLNWVETHIPLPSHPAQR